MDEKGFDGQREAGCYVVRCHECPGNSVRAFDVLVYIGPEDSTFVAFFVRKGQLKTVLAK